MSILAEIAIVFGVCLISERISALLPFSFPASVISMILLLLLLMTGVVKERKIQTLSTFLLTNMGLFFVPSLVGTLEYLDILKAQAIPFLVVTLLSTPLVYLVTAWTVQLLMRAMKRKGDSKNV